MPPKKGADHPNWKGGVTVDDKGYLRITAGPLRNRRVHDVVMEGVLGRPLASHEDVHHKDEDKLNPHWSNLEVLDHGAHSQVTNGLKFNRRAALKAEKEQWKDWINEETSFEPDSFDEDNDGV